MWQATLSFSRMLVDLLSLTYASLILLGKTNKCMFQKGILYQNYNASE